MTTLTNVHPNGGSMSPTLTPVASWDEAAQEEDGSLVVTHGFTVPVRFVRELTAVAAGQMVVACRYHEVNLWIHCGGAGPCDGVSLWVQP